MIHALRAAVGCLLLIVIFGACTMHESVSQDPPAAAQHRPDAGPYPNPYPVHPSEFQGLDPVERMRMRDRISVDELKNRVADLEKHLGNAYRIVNVQQRQIGQLQRIVFGIGSRSGPGVAPIGQEPIGMPPEIDAGIGAPAIGQAPNQSETPDAE